MGALFAIIALLMVLLIALTLFGNELYWRRRISACGLILLFCSIYLIHYLDGLNYQVKYYATELAKYRPVDISKMPDK